MNYISPLNYKFLIESLNSKNKKDKDFGKAFALINLIMVTGLSIAFMLNGIITGNLIIIVIGGVLSIFFISLYRKYRKAYPKKNK